MRDILCSRFGTNLGGFHVAGEQRGLFNGLPDDVTRSGSLLFREKNRSRLRGNDSSAMLCSVRVLAQRFIY